MNGLLIVDKPLGVTSFDVIRNVRKEYNIKKVGHIGTLDPMATGVLPILIGDATRLSDYLMEHDKEYYATLKLGEKRDTGDQEGRVIEEREIKELALEDNNVANILNSFIGESLQTPPMYSALKVNGKKLYELAREGKNIERASRKIIITEINVINIDKGNNEIHFRVVCSKGTYIRVLCEDIAEKLETVGYMKALRRTRVGNFRIEDEGKFIEIEDILKDNEIINLKDEEEYKKLINGVKIKTDLKDGLHNVYYEDNFKGIGEVLNHILKRKIII